MERKKWNDKEITILKEIYPDIDLVSLKKILNRSSASIYLKAEKLKIKKNFKYSKKGKTIIIALNKQRNGKNHPRWTGNDIKSKSNLHAWVRKRKSKPKLCENCKKKESYDLASKTGKLTRNPNDYKWLCRSCHFKLDIKLGFRKKDKTGKWIKIDNPDKYKDVA